MIIPIINNNLEVYEIDLYDCSREILIYRDKNVYRTIEEASCEKPLKDYINKFILKEIVTRYKNIIAAVKFYIQDEITESEILENQALSFILFTYGVRVNEK